MASSLFSSRRCIVYHFIFGLSLRFVCTSSSIINNALPSKHASRIDPVVNRTVSFNWGYFHVADSVTLGVTRAVEECKYQFRWDRWNCPVSPGWVQTKMPFKKVTREIAYLQAISSAGVLYYVTKKCNQPRHDVCGCRSTRYNEQDSESWKWGGCRQDINFGEQISKLFMGTVFSSTDETSTALKRHNERAGHRAVKKTLGLYCKCHGNTSSCTFRTCWQKVSRFRNVAALLKKKYNKSKALYHDNKAQNVRVRRIPKDELWYSAESADYCKANRYGLRGTYGRVCIRKEKHTNKTSLSKWERNSCRRLCKQCGYKTKKLLQDVYYDCDCHFNWCCSVECKKCKKTVPKYYCS